jgi:hypothetical protein
MSSVTYFAEDGNYGDAANMRIIDTSKFTKEEWEQLDKANDNLRSRLAFVIHMSKQGDK